MNSKDQNQLTENFKSYASKLDMDLVGIAGLDEFNKHAKIGRRPIDIWPEAKAIVAFAFGFLDPLSRIWVAPQGELTHAASLGLNILDIWETKLKTYLRKKGYRSTGYMDFPGTFQVHLRQSEAFRLAGLGYVGKSNLAISEKYGSRMNLGTFMTDAPLVPDEPYTENHCGECNICQKYCTSRAIMGDGYFNARLCESVVNCAPDSATYYSLSSWADCDICQRKCPKGKYKWEPEECRGNWWDVVRRNRESSISDHSFYLKRNIAE